MDVQRIKADLEQKYPGKTIVVNDEVNPTEILCEIEPASDHPDYSVAISVIDETVEHFHRETTEIYEVLSGELKITKEGKEYTMKPGESFVIHPGEKHMASGHETWIKVTSEPGWKPEDHHFVHDAKIESDPQIKTDSH